MALNLKEFIKKETVVFNSSATTPTEAIDVVGSIMLQNGDISKEYIESMHKRNADVSVYIGNGIAIPHGQDDSRTFVKKTSLTFATFPNGLKWGDEVAYVVIGIASKNDEHLEILTEIAIKLSDEENVDIVSKASTIEEMIKGFE